jgi:hypothetical protein
VSTGIASRSARVAPNEALVYKNHTIPAGVCEVTATSSNAGIYVDVIKSRLLSVRPIISFSQTPRSSPIRTPSTQTDGYVPLRKEII